MRRVGALVVSALLVAGVAVAAVWNLWGSSPTVVSGVIGSEKATFFADPQVVERLAELGYEADIRTGGSREIATTDLDGVDFAFPSSDPSAEVLRRNNAVERVYRPFYSPMVVLSYRPVAEALARAGVARRAQDGAWDLDMAAYLDLTEERTRWRDLPGDALGGAGRGEVLIRTTDPRTSNSAAMYLVVVSYLLNGEEVVTDAAAEPGLVEEAARLFLAQGSPPASSQQPFDQFVALGAGHTPLLWAYEQQYITARTGPGGLPEDVVLLYPGPTTVATHTLLPLTEEGDAFGGLLTEDPELQRLAAEHGFRTTDARRFADLARERELPVRDQVADVVPAPSYEVVEDLIGRIEERYTADGRPAPAGDDGAAGGTAAVTTPVPEEVVRT
ncbi:hypothetical protein HNR12_005011 [Streptomonospora nanhaiensis]|uniref:Extracellular solute-binding protein n=1 Tax=Streptomonospora nanhaiensis TaxID=1323731 RepID=A0A853BUS0_9ACTN|nr:hypothetical protein [Streptomonospora nanhaiensis]